MRTAPATTPVRESAVEHYLTQRCQSLGFLSWKYISPTRGGVPDRIVITSATTCFVEVKRPGEEISNRQIATIETMRKAGAQVHIVDSATQVDELIEHLREQVDNAQSAEHLAQPLAGDLRAASTQRRRHAALLLRQLQSTTSATIDQEEH